MNHQRAYQRSHPWLTFELDLARAPIELWLRLGEACSKCEHISGVPLKPRIAEEMSQVYLAKGIQATTAIEGNTLSEAEIHARIDRRLSLPESREYLGVEVDNVLDALRAIWQDTAEDSRDINVADLLDWNRRVLQGVALDPPAVAGQVRDHQVGVGRYLGAPPEDCAHLLSRLCHWLNQPWDTGRLGRMGSGILKAVVAHVYLAWIHPFGDGNGRTARLLEFRILTASGVPDLAAHMLTNHYNLTRAEYYRQLEHASQSGGHLMPFLVYALNGFVDGLRSQIAVIRGRQFELAWRDYVHESLPDSDGKASIRQKQLVLGVPTHDFATVAAIKSSHAGVALAYKDLTRQTLMRDIERLCSLGLLVKRDSPQGTEVRAALERILAFLPRFVEEGHLV